MIQASNTHIDIIKDYQHNIEVHEVIIGKLERNKKALAFTRLITVLGGVIFAWYFWPQPDLFFPVLSCFQSFSLFWFSLMQINQQP